MSDLYLKSATEAEMTTALIEAGLAYDNEGTLAPAEGVSLDVIGQITQVTGYDEAGEPIIQTLPDWHVNVRCGDLTEEQAAIIAPFELVPPNTPYRVWA